MGTTSSLSYAMGQSHLKPIEQLALMMIADACAVWFTPDEALEIVVSHTSIDPMIAESVINHLIQIKHINSHPHTNVGKYFVPELHEPILERATATPVTVRDFSGYVYLLQSPKGAYKIGKTVNPKSRFQTFKTALPFEVEYACVIKTHRMSDLERELHQQFSSKRINGEWFNLEPQDVEYIKSLVVNNG